MTDTVSKPRAAVFLDRDGVLNRPVVRNGRPYPPQSVEEFVLYAEAREACSILQQFGPLVVITNQPDVGRGQLDRAIVETMHEIMRSQLPISHIEVCYEDGRDPQSKFYKPAIGMLQRASDMLKLDLSNSVFIGDRWRDVECGRAAGCLTLFIERGYSETLPHPPDHTVNNLLGAAQLLVPLGRINPTNIHARPRAT